MVDAAQNPTQETAEEIAAGGSTADARDTRNAVRAAPLDKKTAELLTRIYLTRRVNYQISFYQNRIREFDNNSDVTFRWGALVMSFSTLFAAISLGVEADSNMAPFLRLLTVILPALAALVNSFRQLYQWDRQAAIYRDTILGLEEVKLILPDMDTLDAETAQELYPEMVKQAERVFQNEVSQWGQVAQGKQQESANAEVVQAFRDMKFDIFDADGNLSTEKLHGLRKQVTSGDYQAQITVEVPETPALPHQASADYDDNTMDDLVESDQESIMATPAIQTVVDSTEDEPVSEEPSAPDDGDEDTSKGAPGTEDFAG